MSPVTKKNTVQQTTVRARKTAILEWEEPPTPAPVPEPVADELDFEFEVMVAFIESDEREGPVYLSLFPSRHFARQLGRHLQPSWDRIQ